MICDSCMYAPVKVPSKLPSCIFSWNNVSWVANIIGKDLNLSLLTEQLLPSLLLIYITVATSCVNF